MKRIKLTLQLLFILLLGACAAKNTADVNQSTTSDKNDYRYLGDSYLSDFYIIAEKDLPKTAGTLLRQQPLLSHQSISGAAKNIRLLYTSTSGIDGSIVPVSGALFLPEGEAPAGGWPIILWSHGTVGIADTCAPSWTGYIPLHDEYLQRWLNQGYAIVASDYQGLGTEGTHPYLATEPAALSNLDILRAVQSIDLSLSEKIVIVGQSQGAGAAIATAEYAKPYAPELDIRGVVATGVPHFTPRAITIIQQSRPKDVVDPMLGYNFLALTLVQQFDPNFDIAEYVSEQTLPTVKAVADICNRDMRSKIKEMGLTHNMVFKADPLKPLQVAFDKMTYPSLALTVPMFVGSGSVDRDTPLRMQRGVVELACSAGSVVEAHVYDGFDHLSALNHSTTDSIAFVKALMTDQQVRGNCNNLPF
jgi:pimeloyl-ACP methyl ester carboxylesterase